MSKTTRVDYFLPITRANLRGSVTTVTDTLIREDGQPVRTQVADHTFSLITIADIASKRTVSLSGGLGGDYSLDMVLTEDGRLTTAEATSTGQAGTFLAAGVTAAAIGAALAAGQIPLAAALGAAVAHAAGTGEKPLSKSAGAQLAPKTDPVWDAYRTQQPDLAARTTRLLRQRAETEANLDQARDDLRGAIADPFLRQDCRQRIEALQALLADLDADLERLQERFAAWREKTRIRQVAIFDELLPLDALPRLQEGRLVFGTDELPQKARGFWDTVGCILATVDQRDDQTAPARRPSGDAALQFVRPRPMVLAHVKKTSGNPVVTRFDRVLVMDHMCRHLVLPLRKSRTGKRRTSVRLSALGALIGVSYGVTSGTAGTTAWVSSVAADLPAELEKAETPRGGGDTPPARSKSKE